MLSLVLIAMGNAAMPYYAIDNRMSSLMAYEYDVSFDKTVMLEKFCKHSIDVGNHPVDAVRSAHCYTKCGMDSGADPDCTDYHSDTDLPTEPSLCVSREMLFTLCGMLEECWGVTHNTGLYHGYLNTYACQSATAIHPKEGRDIYVKTLADKYDECELGVGAELIGGAFPDVAGVYEQQIVDGMITYAQVQPELGSKLTWHHSGCGWVVSKNIATYKPPAVAPAPECPDDNAAANELFGQDGLDYDPNICATAGQVWGEGSYCANSAFAAVCKSSCLVPCGDSNRAMRQLLGPELLNLPEDQQGGCDAPAVAENCNVVASALCPSKCPASGGRRLQEADGPGLFSGARLQGKFRRLMADHRLNKLGQHLEASKGRRLGVELPYAGVFDKTYEEIYYTFDPAPVTKPDIPVVCTPGVPDLSALMAGKMFAVKKWNDEFKPFVGLTCPGQPRYVVGKEDSFCTGTNSPAMYSTVPAVVKNACFLKCTLSKPEPAYHNSISEDGEMDWCSGNFKEFTNLTNAICLPREECEKLCDELGDDCMGFDMHRKYPLCYLNRPTCSDPNLHQFNTTWDIIEKTQTANEITNAYDDPARDAYTTYSGKTVAGGAPASSVSVVSRTGCEDICSRIIPDCIGFIYKSYCPSPGAGKMVDEASCAAAGAEATCAFLNETILDGHGKIKLREGYLPLETDISGGVPVLDYSVVIRKPHTPCVVTVDNTPSGTFDGMYTKLELIRNDTFLNKDNLTRIRYMNVNETVGNYTPECDGWLMEANLAQPVVVSFFNCSDVPEAANTFFAYTDHLDGFDTATNTTPKISPMQYPCQWGMDSGFCEDSVFSGICAHTCSEFDSQMIKEKKYVYQNLSTDVPCFGDDDAALSAFAAAKLPSFDLSGGPACKQIAKYSPYYNFTHSPCHKLEIDAGFMFAPVPVWKIISSLCKSTCANTTLPPLILESEYEDEATSKGSQYPDRRLQAIGTVSSSGGSVSSFDGFYLKHVYGGITVSYDDGVAPDEFWLPVMKSWKNGTSDPYSPESGFYFGPDGMTLGTPCGQGYDISYSAGSGFPAFDLLTTTPFYTVAVPEDADVKLASVCRVAEACPEMTTCVLGANRFAEELAKFRLPGILQKTEPISMLSAGALAEVKAAFAPKVIVTETRAEAYMSGEAMPSAAMNKGTDAMGSVYRSVPGATRVKFENTAFGDMTVVTLASATAAAGAYAYAELGRAYEPVMGYSDWHTDVVRIERFGTGGTFTFHIYAPNEPSLLYMFVFPLGSTDPLPTPLSPDSPVDMSSGYYKFSVPGSMLPADFVGAVDIDECADEATNPCHREAVCTNVLGGSATCSCRSGYVGDGIEACVMKAEDFSAAQMPYYMKLEHLDRLDFGWRVSDIKLFTTGTNDEPCSTPIPSSTIKTSVSSDALKPGAGASQMDLDTYDKITKSTYVYTGNMAYSHYPGDPWDEHGNKNIFDDNTNTEWWSGSLSLNPEVEGPGGAASIVFVIPGDVRVDCIDVTQSENHMATKLKLTRGPTMAKGSTCSTAPEDELCEPTATFEMDATSTVTTFATECGDMDTQYFGEVLELDEAPGWEGSYANDNAVPSACHCLALCVQHLSEGCRSYKYFDGMGIKHCYLQSNIFGEGEGYFGGSGKLGQWPNWRSGTPGMTRHAPAITSSPALRQARIVGFEPAVVQPGQEFTLKINGVGLPFDATARFNTAPRQRVKIMDADAPCYAKPPEEVTGIGCTETQRKVQTPYGVETRAVYTICSPRPSETSAESVSFADIMITESSEAKEYKVCYCATQCYEPSSYVEIPGRLKMDMSTFTWSVESETVYRKEAAGPTELNIVVQRPSFATHSNPKEWELKLVRDYFGCGVLADTEKFSCVPDAMPPKDTHDFSGPSVIWERSTPGTPAGAENASAPVALGVLDAVFLTFSEAISTDGCMGGFSLVSGSSTISTVPCSEAIVDGSELYLMFAPLTAPSTGASLAIAWSSGAVKDMSGNSIDAGSTSDAGVNFVAASTYRTSLQSFVQSTVSSVEVLTSSPALNGQFLGTNATMTLYTSTGNLASPGNVTLTDCGDDGLCGSADDLAITDITVVTGYNTIKIMTGAVMLSGHRFEIAIPAGQITSSNGVVGPVEDFTVSFMAGCPLPSYLANPDVAHWVYSLDMAVADTGAYLVCFRERGGDPFVPIPSETETTLTVSKIEADRTHPRGIFHNQYFSSLAKSPVPLNITVAGTRIPTPTDSKILINKMSTCGTAAFSGLPVLTTPMKKDTTPPFPILEEFYPAPGAGGISQYQALSMKFSEAVMTGPSCTGNISFVPTDGTASYTVSCANTTALKDQVIVMPPAFDLGSEGKTYNLHVETGAILDLAGNPMPVLFTLYDLAADGTQYTLTTGTDETVPAILNTYPCDMCERHLSYVDPSSSVVYTDTVVLVFSERVTSVTDTAAQIILADCGSDMVCDPETDVVINYFDVGGSSLTFTSMNLVYVDVGALPAFKRYKMTVPANAFTDIGAATTGPSSSYSFEFVALGTETYFDYATMAVSATNVDSVDDALKYALSIDVSDMPSYTVCYCDDQRDETLEDLGDGDTTYKIYEDLKCLSGTLDEASAVVGDRTVAEHVCETKCSKGCSGPFCYCDGYEAQTVGPDTLCLPPALCREACDAAGSCGGINIHDFKPQCLLLPAGGECIGAAVNATDVLPDSIMVAEEWQLFSKTVGTACTNLADYEERAGSLFVTAKVQVAVDYVLHPGKMGSIELTSPPGVPGALTFEHSPVMGFTATKLLTKDRITIIDCKGTCGVSSPTSAVVSPAMGDKIATWNNFNAYSWFTDLPSIDSQNPVDPDTQISYVSAANTRKYQKRDASYCPGANVNLDEIVMSTTNEMKPRVFPWGGLERPLKEHQCFTKCSLNAPCDDSGDEEYCFCDGHYSGYDGIESNALCADLTLCEYLCDNTPGCVSIDKHSTRNRCFLNLASMCDSHEDNLAKDTHYDLYIKKEDGNDEQAGNQRQLEVDAKGKSRSLMPAMDLGFSWESMLRFKDIQFKSGGTFKLCFCDSSLLSGVGAACASERDYTVEVGMIHASGVSCLISNPQLQRVSCTEMMHGGLRCYSFMDAPSFEPPKIGVTELGDGTVLTPSSISANCLFMPEEEARANPACQTVAAFQSTDPLRK
jgi:hypothetical protein